jgi:4-alpha-glucanotransferase
MHSRYAGVLVPLFSLNREADLGRGDIGGLPLMAQMASAMGHRLIQMLPNDETAPGESSPYTAISVFALDPMYIAADQLGLSSASLKAAERKLGLDRHLLSARTIERERLYPVKLRLLEAAHKKFRTNTDSQEHQEFAHFVESNRYWLEDYALFRALKARFRWRGWDSWPPGARDHDPAAISKLRNELADEIVKYQYWQFIGHRQWLQVRATLRQMDVALGGDLAFSPGRDSAEVWANQRLFDLGRSVGAPPDAFSIDGQRWGLPMPKWEAMRAEGFGLIRARVRRARELFDILRIDHVVGLYRTYSFADDAAAGTGRFDPAEEPVQLKHGEEVIRAIQQESGPMGLIAEDLGLVPPFVRKSLTAMGVPGYKVMRWEKENWNQPDERFISPVDYPELSLATTGTHDTESLQSWWRELSLAERTQLIEVLHLDSAQPSNAYLSHETREAVIEALYAAPSRFTITPLQDLLGWSARINTPGTVDPHNWRWRIPCPLERMMASQSVRARLERLKELVRRTGRA